MGRESVDLSRFAGRTVKLAFLTKTDKAHLNTFYVDDVALDSRLFNCQYKQRLRSRSHLRAVRPGAGFSLQWRQRARASL